MAGVELLDEGGGLVAVCLVVEMEEWLVEEGLTGMLSTLMTISPLQHSEKLQSNYVDTCKTNYQNLVHPPSMMFYQQLNISHQFGDHTSSNNHIRELPFQKNKF